MIVLPVGPVAVGIPITVSTELAVIALPTAIADGDRSPGPSKPPDPSPSTMN
jgi:hypothetical protein